MSLSETVKKYRESTGLSLRDLSYVTGVSYAQLSRIERGKDNVESKTYQKIMSWINKGKKLPNNMSLLQRVEQLEARLSEVERFLVI